MAAAAAAQFNGPVDIAAGLLALAEDALRLRLPIRLRAWDGSEAGVPGAPVVVLRDRRALRHVLWSPGELGVARTYVQGHLDAEGDLAGGSLAIEQNRMGVDQILAAEPTRAGLSGMPATTMEWLG